MWEESGVHQINPPKGRTFKLHAEIPGIKPENKRCSRCKVVEQFYSEYFHLSSVVLHVDRVNDHDCCKWRGLAVCLY